MRDKTDRKKEGEFEDIAVYFPSSSDGGALGVMMSPRRVKYSEPSVADTQCLE